MARRNQITIVPVGELQIHPEAQRRIVPAQLKKRMADLDTDAVGVLHGVEINGVIYIIDGQHRVVALKQHGLYDFKVRVELHQEAVDPVRAHALFLRLNARTSPSSYDTFLNELGAQMSPAVGVQKITDQFGFKTSRQAGDGHIACVSALKRIWEIDEGQTLTKTFEVVVAAHGTVMSAVEAKYLEGLSAVIFANNGVLDESALVKKLSKYPGGASGVLGDAKGLKKIRRSSLSRCVAETVVEAYNSGRRDPNRLPLP